MKRTLIRIAYALGLKRLAHRISPSLYCMELGKRAAKNFEKGFKIALADVEGQAAFQQRLQEWLTEDHIEEEVRRKITKEEAGRRLDYAMGEIYDQVFYDDKPYEFDKDEYEALDMAYEALKQTQWIPCSERLPKQNGVYIVTRAVSDGFEYRNITDACYFDGSDVWHDDTRVNHGREYLADVIAWMPKPKPYEGSEE